jgi:hypothetical protein
MRNLTVAVVMLVVLCGGCAAGVKYKYDHQELSLAASSALTVEVGVVDQRPYVLTNESLPTFVGVSRGGFGEPFHVNTESGQPLAIDIGNDIVASLQASGLKASLMEVKPMIEPAEIQQKLIASGADRAVLLALREWQTDTYHTVELHYDVRLNIFNREGQTLATTQRSGQDNLGDRGFDPASPSRKAIPVAFKKIMEELFHDPTVVAALK